MFWTPIRAALAASLFTLAGAVLPAAAEAQGFRGAERPETFAYGGRERSYWVADGRADAAAPAPLLIALHGGGRGDADRLRAGSGFDELAWIADIVTVMPTGIDGGWNDGRTDGAGALLRATDDVGFLTALIEKLVADGRADPEKVFVVGVSNGGMMSLRLACERSALLAGAAAIIANQPAGLRCPDGAPVPMLLIHGDRDPLVRYEGGEVGGWGDRGSTLSVPATVDFWAARNGCRDAVRISDRDGVDDGTRLEIRDQIGCAAPLRHVIAFGAGHTVPGAAERRFMRPVLGRTSQEIEAGQAVWEFFATLPGS